MPNYTSLVLAGLVLACTSLSARAELGGNLSSIEADRVHMNAPTQAQVTAAAAYSVHELTLPSGTLVRQYVSASGIVFAVAWSGPFKPDLRQLLGPHFNTLLAKQSHTPHAGHSHSHVKENNLVIESGGHMRDFYGRAYLPNELPVGVTPQDIQ